MLFWKIQYLLNAGWEPTLGNYICSNKNICSSFISMPAKHPFYPIITKFYFGENDFAGIITLRNYKKSQKIAWFCRVLPDRARERKRSVRAIGISKFISRLWTNSTGVIRVYRKSSRELGKTVRLISDERIAVSVYSQRTASVKPMDIGKPHRLNTA